MEEGIPAEDRFSALPDQVLTHITSFLPMEDIFKISNLSFRLSNFPIHKFTFTIGSHYLTKEDVERFAHFVGMNLLACFDGVFNLEITFTHNCYMENFTPYIKIWCNHLVQRGVRELSLIQRFIPDVDYYPDKAHYLLIPRLPVTVLQCKTLTILKLRWFTTTIIGSGSIFSRVQLDFPVLKILHVEFLEFDTDRDFALILAASPLLEDYLVSHVYSTERAFYRRFRKKNAPLHEEFRDLRLSHLVKADMTGLYIHIPMQSFPNMKFLRLQLSKVYHPLPSEFPVFQYLTHLVINFDWHEMTIEVLKHCPNLQMLDLYQIIDRQSTHLPPPPLYLPQVNECELPEAWVDPASVPPCIGSHLISCSIRDFGAMDLKRDISFSKFILNNAGVLNTMSIWSSSAINKVLIEDEIFSSQRASATCQISVY
ncbi:putative F-box domain, FBD domain, leucine-rich repeat domain, L domain-containing protein [Medicago truncatula]|uniref:Putative F-box domain, FBD domain, leucine-rich repeat domain, L domain-containing protein n=1 Tax=Medicago truncatula TaxID=3880 RepID=A0A396H0D0_MEDTR|nr:putative F-box domain, FBD domain, leucine-rich repeat domain, L domain-containing protein [Medicago truncatula]